MARSRTRARYALGAVGMLYLLAGPGPAFADSEQSIGDGTRPKSALSLHVGRSSPDDFTSILTSPWSASLEDMHTLVASGAQLIWEFDDNVWLEGELGLSRRFGESDAWEVFGLVFLRWDGLPWSEILYTSVGVGIGPSYTTGVSETERRKSGNGKGSKVLNMLVPEIAIALPDHEDVQLTFRLHHRSGIFGLINDTVGGSTFLTAGVRMRF